MAAEPSMLTPCILLKFNILALIFLHLLEIPMKLFKCMYGWWHSHYGEHHNNHDGVNLPLEASNLGKREKSKSFRSEIKRSDLAQMCTKWIFPKILCCRQHVGYTLATSNAGQWWITSKLKPSRNWTHMLFCQVETIPLRLFNSARIMKKSY